MNLDLSDKQWQLLLETLGKAHVVQYVQNKDNSSLEELIAVIALTLQINGKDEIFQKVFREIKK